MLTDAGPGAVVEPSTPNGFWYVAQYVSDSYPAARFPTWPGQGLSAVDDMGPNDDTQVFVGPAEWSPGEFTPIAPTVDIFSIEQ